MPGVRYIASVPWTPAEHEQLRKLWLAGVGPTEIARVLDSHRSKNAVIKQARNLKLPKMRPNNFDPHPPPDTAPQPCPQPLRPGAHTLPPLPSELDEQFRRERNGLLGGAPPM